MYIEWKADYATGLEIVDAQHRSLIRIINELYSDIGEGRGDVVLQRVFGELRRYAEHHFGTEERLLKRHGLPAGHSAAHLAEHDDYCRRVAQLRFRYDEGERLVPVQVLAFVSEWWLRHIATSDRIFVALAAGDSGAAEQAAR